MVAFLSRELQFLVKMHLTDDFCGLVIGHILTVLQDLLDLLGDRLKTCLVPRPVRRTTLVYRGLAVPTIRLLARLKVFWSHLVLVPPAPTKKEKKNVADQKRSVNNRKSTKSAPSHHLRLT